MPPNTHVFSIFYILCQEDIKWKLVRDIGPVLSWIQSHLELFCGEKIGPDLLQMDSKNQQNAIKDYLGSNRMKQEMSLFIHLSGPEVGQSH